MNQFSLVRGAGRLAPHAIVAAPPAADGGVNARFRQLLGVTNRDVLLAAIEPPQNPGLFNAQQNRGPIKSAIVLRNQKIPFNQLLKLEKLLPLDCGRRLTRNIVNNPVNTPHFINYSV
jgi:hypothetical protein